MADGVLLHADRDTAAAFEKHLLTTPEFAPGEPEEELAPAPEPVEAPAVEEPEAEETVDAAPEEEAPAQPEEEESINTFAEMAEAYELEEQDLLDHLQIEGRDGEMVPLAAVVQGYRDQPAFDAAKAPEVEALKTQFREAHDEGMLEMQRVTAQMIERLKANGKSDEEWEHLRKSDPSEWIKQQEMQKAERYAAEQSVALMEKEKQKHKEMSDAIEAQYIEEEKVKIFVLHPEWRGDEKVGQAAFADIQSYSSRLGYNDEQMRMASAADISTLWKAAQYEKLTKDKKLTRKRLRGLPAKHVKQSARDESGPQRQQMKARQAARNKFHESGEISDAMEFFKEHVDI